MRAATMEREAPQFETCEILPADEALPDASAQAFRAFVPAPEGRELPARPRVRTFAEARNDPAPGGKGLPVNMDRQGNMLAWSSVGPMRLHVLAADELLRGSARALCGTGPVDAQRIGRWHSAGVPISACTCSTCWDRYQRLQDAARAPEGRTSWKCVCGRERGELDAPQCGSCCSVRHPDAHGAHEKPLPVAASTRAA